ncbi:MAG: site-specific integrase [Lachnospiraceae bacterium]|nr:site-specific integrase [Lachnospiraceae bacterium]
MKKRKGQSFYEKKVTLGWDDAGNKIRRSVYGSTKAEVDKKAFDIKQEWLSSTARPSDEMTMVTYARYWFNTSKSLKSINTKAMYNNLIEKHLSPALGDMYFDEISLANLQNMINAKRDKRETCRKLKMMLKQIYNAAQEDGYPIKFNINRLEVPKKKSSNKRPLTEAERIAIFQCKTFTVSQRLFVHILYYTGIRREEALALTYKDIDLKGKKISITKTVVFDGETPVLQNTTKNKASFRDIPIPDMLVDELRENKRVGYLFTMPTAPDRLMTKSSYTKFWAGIQKALVPLASTAGTLTAHIFRHNYATILYYSDVSMKMAIKLMGHSSAKMIMEVYAHLDEAKEMAPEKLEAFFKSLADNNNNETS